MNALEYPNVWLASLALAALGGLGSGLPAAERGELTDAQVEEIVRRSYPYVALYNVIQKGALDEDSPASTGGFNKIHASTQLFDHNVKLLARPNNDSLYITCMMDLRKDPVLLDCPVFGSLYSSLMAVAYDHYINVVLSTRMGDFEEQETLLFYSARTEGYHGEPVEGVDRVVELSGDFVTVVFRVMPHASDPDKYRQIVEVMKTVKMETLSEFRGEEAKPIDDVAFPAFGQTDGDIFEHNLAEVMQFVANHTTFDEGDELDRSVLAAWKLIGVAPGKAYDPSMRVDGERFRVAAERIKSEALAALSNTEATARLAPLLLQSKGKTSLEAIVLVSIIGPGGLPMAEAYYPPVATSDREGMNAQHDYVIRMPKDELPPARAFWSLTLYDRQTGFFIPNDRKKYSVGRNSGMKLDEDGGIEIYVAAENPQGVPQENWLPIIRGDQDLDIILRIYVPDLGKLRTWSPPKAWRLDASG